MASPAAVPVVLIRYGEVGLKGSNRAWFERILRENLRKALRPLGPWEVHNLRGRLVLAPGDREAFGDLLAAAEQAAAAASRVFGVVGAGPAREVPPDLPAILAAAEALVARRLPAEAGTPLSFKVAARRSNKRFPLDSMQLNREVGAHLLRAFGGRLVVNVHDPQLVVRVEVRDGSAFVYDGERPGPGGLPVGVSGRALALLSGGIDSPVAAWMGMKRGLRVDGVHFHAMPFTTEQALLKVVRLGRLLAAWQGDMRLFLTRFTDVQKAIYTNCPPDYGVILMRRMMVRIANVLADRHRYHALVTGENLGQVASQTLPSMAAVEAVSRRIILRPLVGMDKTEIVEAARRIGTYDTSTEAYEDCCTLFVARHPQTRPALERVEAVEARLDVAGLVDDAVAHTEVVEAADEPAFRHGVAAAGG
ncbi:MAG: tRNA uracil 4-sulfurtransferase ThiI [Bacillota bacterium]